MSPFKVSIEITDILEEGNCPLGHVVGETFHYPEDRGKICPILKMMVTLIKRAVLIISVLLCLK